MQTKIVYIHKNIFWMEFKREQYIQKLELMRYDTFPNTRESPAIVVVLIVMLP